MNKSIVEIMREFIKTCPYINEFAPVHVDITEDAPENYGVDSNGESITARYMDGATMRRHNFILYARAYTEDDETRISNSGFMEHFSNWLQDCTRSGKLPDLGEGRSSDVMEAANGMLFSLDPSGKKGIYQIQFYLIYSQE